MNDIERIARAVQFAAEKHTRQRRKGASEAPYINHLATVAANVAAATSGADANLIIAAYLHDCVEDCGVKPPEIVAAFDEDVASLVVEVSDDKTKDKEVRKRLVIEHAPHKSARGKVLKLADLVANLSELLAQPAVNWSAERVQGYFDWASQVVDGLRSGSPAMDAPALLAEFDALIARRAEIKPGPMRHPLALAIKIAAAAHATHTPDKGGAPYILHPLRMMMRMSCDDSRMVAVLHDVVEDHSEDGWTFESLDEAGIPKSVIAALRCVTKTEEEERLKDAAYEAFIDRAATHPVAIKVKLADLEDNMNVLRLGELTDKDVVRLRKYHKSWKHLSSIS